MRIKIENNIQREYSTQKKYKKPVKTSQKYGKKLNLTEHKFFYSYI